jgi:predicted ATPase
MTDDTVEDDTLHRHVPFISRVRLKNYKSIAECDVHLGPLTILAGPNGSGKSNFLDAIAFMARALSATPAEALDERGGVREIVRKAPARAESFSISVEANVPWWPAIPEFRATYAIEIGAKSIGSNEFDVIREECVMQDSAVTARLKMRLGQGDMQSDEFTGPVHGAQGRLVLQSAGIPSPFPQLGDGLRRPRFYNFDTNAIRIPRPAASRVVLERNGNGLGDVLSALGTDEPWVKARVDAYLSAIMQSDCTIEPLSVGEYTAIALKTRVADKEFEFGSLGMSDGTIRAAAVLASLFQPEALDGRLPLLGIEEPEAALHPAAAGAIFDALTEANEHVQVIATSQSADLLDREDLDASAIRPVVMRDGLTIIGEVDEVSREIAREKLFTLGELMRGNQLVPRPPDTTGSAA